MSNGLGEAGMKVFFPGENGVPFLGASAPTLPKNPSPREELSQVAMANVKVFRMDDPKQVEEYRKLWDLVTSGTAIVGFEDRQYVPEEKTWFILIRYATLAAMTQKDANQRVAKIYDGTVNVT